MQQQRDKTDRAYNKIATGLKLVHIRIILFAYLYTITTTILLLLVRIILTFFLSHLNLWQRLWRRSHLLHSLAQCSKRFRSFTANSAKIFLSKHTLSTPIPRINSAYFTPCSRLAALIRTIIPFSPLVSSSVDLCMHTAKLFPLFGSPLGNNSSLGL